MVQDGFCILSCFNCFSMFLPDSSFARSQWSVLQATQASLKPQYVAMLKRLQPSSSGLLVACASYVYHMGIQGNY